MYDPNDEEQMMQLMEEFRPDLRQARLAIRRRRKPLDSVLEELLPLRPESLFLGVAEDGRPVLLTISDAQPGPLMILGGPASGKTAFLKMIARSIETVNDASDIQYGVITSHPDDWEGIGGAQNCVDIFPAYKDSAQEFVRSLDEWARSNHSGGQSVVLLVDDMSCVMRMDSDVRQSMRWLLVRGPSRRVWPIATLNPKWAREVDPWLPFFRTRLFGSLVDPMQLGEMGGRDRPPVDQLQAGSEFLMREAGNWVKFWIPSVD